MKPVFVKTPVGIQQGNRIILLKDKGLYTDSSKEDGIYTIPFSGGCLYKFIYNGEIVECYGNPCSFID